MEGEVRAYSVHSIVAVIKDKTQRGKCGLEGAVGSQYYDIPTDNCSLRLSSDDNPTFGVSVWRTVRRTNLPCRTQQSWTTTRDPSLPLPEEERPGVVGHQEGRMYHHEHTVAALIIPDHCIAEPDAVARLERAAGDLNDLTYVLHAPLYPCTARSCWYTPEMRQGKRRTGAGMRNYLTRWCWAAGG